MTTQKSQRWRTLSRTLPMMGSQRLFHGNSRNVCRMRNEGRKKSRLHRCGKKRNSIIYYFINLGLSVSIHVLHALNHGSWYNAKMSSDIFYVCPNALQNWSKKGSGEKGRGGGGSKLPPRFAKKQQQQGMSAGQQQQPSAPAPQSQSVLQQPQPQPAISVSQHNLPASNQSTSPPQPLEGAVAPLAPASVDFSAKSQTHNTLGTELWENKVAGSTVLSDVKKRKCLNLKPCLLTPHTVFINVT